MTAYLGRVVRAVLPTVSASSAGGFWNPVMAQYYQQAGTWPSGAGADPYFPYNTLLLSGDGTNGAQNNTFLDGSTNNFTVTRNGNTTQGSFNPYVGPGCWSAYFNGASGVQWNNGGRVTVNSTATFTMEAWVYLTATPSATAPILADGQNNTATTYWGFDVNSTRNLQFFWYTGSAVTCASTGTVALNQWTHVAISVSAGAIKLFINGTLQTTTGTSTLTNPSGSTVYMQSGMRGSPANYFTGHISNLRLVNNVALYSATFTPSTTPLIATTSTTLLAFQNNNFNDLSASNAGATSVFSAPQISKFSPFTFYQTTPASYSGYFDGNGDYLSLSASTVFGVGTGDFTIEYWAFYNTFASSPIGFDSRSSSGDIMPSDYVTTGGNLVFYYNSANLLTSTNAAVLGRWNHIAWVRSGTTLTSYINGVASGSTTSSANFGTSQPLRIAGNITAANFLNGSISNFRFTKGQALYTTGFTPSTTPLTTTSQGATASNVSLLTCQSTTFIDNSTNAFTITANGNATPKRANPFTDTVTGPTPYSTTTYGGSAYFDGTGDYLSVADAAALEPGGNSFTVECWFYMTGANATNGSILFSKAASSSYSSISVGFNTVSAGSAIKALSSSTGSSWAVDISGTATATTLQNSWNHVAYVRNGNVFTLYLNGASVATATAAVTLVDNAESVRIGQTNFTSTDFPGYIANLRYVVGTAIYTGPFVPPAAPLTAVTNTRLLVNGTNAGIFDNTTVNDLETAGSAQVSTSVVKYGTGSISFNGLNSYLTFKGGAGTYNGASIAGNGIFYVGNTFTIETWIYPTTLVASTSYWNIILGDVNTTTVTSLFWSVNLTSTGLPAFIWYDGTTKSCVGTTTVPLNAWTHLAFVSTNGVLKIFVNGVSETLTGTTTITLPSGTTGALSSGVDRTRYWAGYLDDLRVTNGVARYSANFTPPGGPFPNF